MYNNYYLIVDIDISATDCVEGEVRLVGGSSEYEGRVEICISIEYGVQYVLQQIHGGGGGILNMTGVHLIVM